MASALTDSSIGENSIELILKAINDMQDKIKADVDEKLTNYVQMPDFTDLQNELKTVSRRVGYNEGVMKELKDITDANSERIENNRKKLTRMQADIDALKGDRGSQMAMYEPVAEVPVSGSTKDGSDGASSEGLEKLQKLIQRVQGDLIRRIAVVEGSLSRVNDLEDDQALIKLDLAKALAPKDPNITREDYDSWNANLKKTKDLEDLLKKLLKDFDVMDGTKIKADILQLFKVTNTFVVKETLLPIDDKLR